MRNFCFGVNLLCSFIFFAFLISPFGFSAENIQNDDCLACHDTLDANAFESSAHGHNLCTSCHVDIKELPHPEELNPVNCSSCHRIESEIYRESDHGKALKAGIEAAACRNCHGDTHTILNSRDPKSPVNRRNIAKTCAVCHEDEKKMSPFALLETAPFKSYLETVHGKALLEKGLESAAVCTDCHGSHDLHAPTNPKSKIYWQNVPNTCGKCHENVLQTYLRSSHGKAAMEGKIEVPVCTDCHGEHTIKSHTDSRASVFTASVSTKVCAHCHAAEKITSKYRLPSDRLKTYMDSYHGLASQAGVTTVASCASCHGAHEVLPSSDPNSMVNRKNLPTTCGKCHPNAGEQLWKGSVHLSPSSSKDSLIYYVKVIYIFLIIFTVSFMVIHNLLDFTKKWKIHYQKALASSPVLRFTPSERIQHHILTGTFVILAYTGFALKYNNEWWALPFKFGNQFFDWRGILHRAAALIFSVLAIYHIGYMFVTKRGRGQLKTFLMTKKDATDLIDTIKYNAGAREIKPRYGHYSYIEKIEYWALAWGTVIMIVTGALLNFENIVMRYFPKWILDLASVIHFYEAVLATLAIVIWHFYFTIFDPDQYPMNTSIFTGKHKKEEKEEPGDTKKDG